MSSIVYEVLITVLILALVILGIGLSIGELEIIHAVLDRNEDIEKVDKNDYLNLDRNVVNGGDVIGFIRYFKDESSVEVKVTAGANTKNYVTETYDSDQFKIDHELSFNNTVTYENNKIKKIECVQQ